MLMSAIYPIRQTNLSVPLRGAALILLAAFALIGCGNAPSQNPPNVQVTSHSVTLSWAADASVVSGYAVYRSTGDPTGPFYPLAITLPGATQYVDTTVTAGETYYYTVTAFDTSNLQSLPTLAVTAAVPTN
jgi:fibronectin type 3 domain-containing protein